jgi:hypothetical protein
VLFRPGEGPEVPHYTPQGMAPGVNAWVADAALYMRDDFGGVLLWEVYILGEKGSIWVVEGTGDGGLGGGRGGFGCELRARTHHTRYLNV